MSLQDIYKNKKQERKEKSKFISLDAGESFEGEYVSVEEMIGSFGPTIAYTFIVNGEEKVFNKSSFRFLTAMNDNEVKEGDKIKVTAAGEGLKRTYTVEKI